MTMMTTTTTTTSDIYVGKKYNFFPKICGNETNFQVKHNKNQYPYLKQNDDSKIPFQ
jgi:hypothetical protein